MAFTKEEIIEIIYSHYCDQLRELKITSAKTIEYKVDSSEFSTCIEDVRQRLKVKLKNGGLCSEILINQLARHNCQIGEIYNNKEDESSPFVEFYNSSEILDIIGLIESGELEGRAFERSKELKNLYKIYHSPYNGIGYSIMVNLKDYWFNNKGTLKREKAFDEILDQSGYEDIDLIFNKMYSKAIYKRQLTGEWLIYTKQNERNYFLCLAKHNEGDKNIFTNKIEPCYIQFPQLRSIKPN